MHACARTGGQECTHAHTSLHGFYCLCVCNYDAAGGKMEHLGALQWNPLRLNISAAC